MQDSSKPRARILVVCILASQFSFPANIFFIQSFSISDGQPALCLANVTRGLEMTVINTNTGALTARTYAVKANDSMTKAMERLASGLRINSAADDAAGLAVANKMESQLRGMNIAIRNSQDGISLVQTAEAGMSEISNMLIRMRELAVQMNNGIYTSSDRSNAQLEIDALMLDVAREDQYMSERLDILFSIPGIGVITALMILVDMPEIGALNNKQVASLAGLAPMSQSSGKWIGKARIQGGRPNLRNAIFMPALVAIRHNADLKTKYDRLVTAGKEKKVAITAVMRKLLVLANALLRDNRKWAEKAA